MVPDSSPRASKGVLILAWRLLSHFFCKGTSLSWLCFVPVGVVPKASEEWFDSFEVLVRFATLRLVWLFPHASWP
jgi:hypothetical protein